MLRSLNGELQTVYRTTKQKRPDLFKDLQLSEKEMILLREYEARIVNQGNKNDKDVIKKVEDSQIQESPILSLVILLRFKLRLQKEKEHGYKHLRV